MGEQNTQSLPIERQSNRIRLGNWWHHFWNLPKDSKILSPFFGNNKLPKKVLHASNRKQKLPSNVLQTIYFRGMEEFEDHVTNEQ